MLFLKQTKRKCKPSAVIACLLQNGGKQSPVLDSTIE